MYNERVMNDSWLANLPTIIMYTLTTFSQGSSGGGIQYSYTCGESYVLVTMDQSEVMQPTC
jgi:hypothetical protein